MNQEAKKKSEASSRGKHLTLRELSLRPGEEWAPRLEGWTLIQIRDGSGYALQSRQNISLHKGMAALVPSGVKASFRASQLGNFSFYTFTVMPARLTGLMTFTEENFFITALDKREAYAKVFSPEAAIAVKMEALFAGRDRGGILLRMDLLRLFLEILAKELGSAAAPEVAASDAKHRLQLFLSETPSDELLEMDFGELARLTDCTPRHLSRIFHELVGMPFRDKRAELRLAKASQLLANGNSKVVDVALESGYKSLSLFNLMFARRFGTSPSKWRQKNADQRDNPGYKQPKNRLRGALI